VAFASVSRAAVRRTEVAGRPNFGFPRAAVTPRRSRAVPIASSSDCPELDCVRHLLPPSVIAAAQERARSIGLGADRVLICADALTEEAHLTALAGSLGTSFEPLDRVERARCPLADDQLIRAAATRLRTPALGKDRVTDLPGPRVWPRRRRPRPATARDRRSSAWQARGCACARFDRLVLATAGGRLRTLSSAGNSMGASRTRAAGACKLGR